MEIFTSIGPTVGEYWIALHRELLGEVNQADESPASADEAYSYTTSEERGGIYRAREKGQNPWMAKAKSKALFGSGPGLKRRFSARTEDKLNSSELSTLRKEEKHGPC